MEDPLSISRDALPTRAVLGGNISGIFAYSTSNRRNRAAAKRNTQLNRSVDALHRFIIEQSHVRGEVVRLDSTLRALEGDNNYPHPVRQLLAETAAATALLAATIKFDGYLTLQVKGNGPVNLLVVEAHRRRIVKGRCAPRGRGARCGYSRAHGRGSPGHDHRPWTRARSLPGHCLIG